MSYTLTTALRNAFFGLLCIIFMNNSVAHASTITDATDIKMLTYTNEAHGYTISYPDLFGEVVLSEDGKGMETRTEDWTFYFMVTTAPNNGKDSLELMEIAFTQEAKIIPHSDMSGENFFTFIYTDDGGKDGVEHLFFNYTLVSPTQTVKYIFKYPASFERTPNFNRMLMNMNQSLKFTKK